MFLYEHILECVLVVDTGGEVGAFVPYSGLLAVRSPVYETFTGSGCTAFFVIKLESNDTTIKYACTSANFAVNKIQQED